MEKKKKNNLPIILLILISLASLIVYFMYDKMIGFRVWLLGGILYLIMYGWISLQQDHQKFMEEEND